MDSELTLFKIAQKTKNPLGIVGLIVIAFYFIAKAILKSERFSSNETLNFLLSMLPFLFWLGLAALIAGIFFHLISKHYARPAKPLKTKMKQKVEKADEVTAMKAKELKGGDHSAHQNVQEANKVIGFDVEKIEDK